jgi:hypothetical protein
MTIRFHKWDIIIAPIVAVIAFGFGAYLPAFLRDTRPPVYWHSAIMQGEAIPGSDIRIIYEGERVRSCPADITDFWILPDGSRVTAYDGPGNWPEIGTIEPVIHATIPDTGPGLYIYRSRITHHCEGGVHNESQPPDLVVMVQ